MDVIYVGKCKGLRNMLREQRREALSRCIKKLESVQHHRFPIEEMIWGNNPPMQFQGIDRELLERKDKEEQEFMMMHQNDNQSFSG